MSNEAKVEDNTFKLPISKSVVYFKELTMRAYDSLNSDARLAAGDLFAYPKYLDVFIEKIEKEDGSTVKDRDLRMFYNSLDAKDGLALITKMNIIFATVELVLEETGLKKERAELQKALRGTETKE